MVIDLKDAAMFTCAKGQTVGMAEFVALYHKGGLEQKPIDIDRMMEGEEEDEEDDDGEIDLGSEDSE